MNKQEITTKLLNALEACDKNKMEDIRFWIYAAIRETSKEKHDTTD